MSGSAGWVYLPMTGAGALGTAVVWARSRGLSELNLVVDGDGGALAHAARGFSSPRPRVWRAQHRALHPVAPASPVVPDPPECPELTGLMSDAGLEVVADHAVWLGEINGLEVARVGRRDGDCSIDIGVGAYDQFASAALRADLTPAAALAEVIAIVRPHRAATSEPHPIGRLVRARWLRAGAVRTPADIGLDALEPIPLLEPRPGLNEPQPAAALGSRDGTSVLAVFIVGMDLAISETTAGLVSLHAPDEVLVVAPRRDHHPRIVESIASLAVPASVVALEGEWSD